ncbi:DUF2141 domain-containing protein [Rhodopirellula sp. SWK7]|uniref:DUF2141 domain-containing protein n=1 Tax=Rhodopirellula sp. SWK7 TaxID=595460 RepID=UPI0002BE1DC2|nr:DUF2141 domain-containing protein [Rhodopirellula sp. SWK7]EMI43036.1 hypothetical protein RRSWK_04530 [Rhodopirellula sp. SWK7]
MDEEHQPVTRPSETAKGRIPQNQRGDVSWKSYSDQWKANHGTLLMCFAAGVFLVGVAVLAFQQNRFQAPAFPDAGSIDQANALNQVAASDVPESNTGIQLEIAGAADNTGEIRVAVYATEESFNIPENAIWRQSIPIDADGFAKVRIPRDELPESFAIAAYHDNNSNGSLDRNALGIPTERYGFSNAARGTVGPPSFESAVIEAPVQDGVIELKIW